MLVPYRVSALRSRKVRVFIIIAMAPITTDHSSRLAIFGSRFRIELLHERSKNLSTLSDIDVTVTGERVRLSQTSL